MNILNLTQHMATPEQYEAGVLEPENKVKVKDLLTFDTIPSILEMEQRAEELAYIAMVSKCTHALIGGASFFMSNLEYALINKGIKPLYSFSTRVSEERVDEDGNVVKINVFKHTGFVEVWTYKKWLMLELA